MKRIALLVLSLLIAAAPAVAQEKLPPNGKLTKLTVYPTSLDLKNRYEYRQVLVTAVLESGDLVDVTRMVAVTAPGVVSVSPTGQVRPKADGTGEIAFKIGTQTVSVPVKVSGITDKYPVSFVRDVMPTMSKLGCNAGTCHGAQDGKNGFKLSLRGYDPKYDYRSLTDDLESRRFNRAAPDNSLMLLKASGAVPHVGGGLMKQGDPAYDMLRDWIAAGVKLDLDSPRVKSIELFPKNPVVQLPGMKQQMAVLATYTNGVVRDVTAEAFIETSNMDVMGTDKGGLVTVTRRGEGAIMARFEGSYAATTLVVMGDRTGFVWKAPAENNYIDTLVYEKLKQVKIQASDVCNDAEFIRRLYLDLTGLPPTPEAVRKFLADTRPTATKRNELIDQLLKSDDYIEQWTNKWADMLQVNPKFLGPNGADALRKYIRASIAANKPYNKFANEVITASGSTMENPAASYYKILRDPTAVMENTTHLFLGVRFNCNKCHDHPFERWTQDQYYQLSAYFAQVSRVEDAKYKGQKLGGTAVEGALPLVEVIADTKVGQVKHERTGLVTAPAFPYTHADVAPATEHLRTQVARWITSKDNQYFARSYVNRMWSYLTGVGIIEPVDDIRAGNPASNPKLLDKLTDDFIASGFDTQKLIRTICQSRVYQHSIVTNQWNEDDQINYSHGIPRRLSAEMLFDAIHRTTGSQSRIPGLPAGARAAQLVDSNVPLAGPFLELFGKPARESACECERSGGVMLGPILNLVNGPIVGDALKDPSNRINQLVLKEKDDAKVVEEIFLAIYGRMPTKKETEIGIKAINGAEEDYREAVAEHAKRKVALDEYEKGMPARLAAWEKSLGTPTNWEVVEFKTLTALSGATFTKQEDGSYLLSGKNATPELYTLITEIKKAGITAIRLEVMADKSLPAQGPGRAPNGNFVLNEFTLLGQPLDNPTVKPRKIPLVKPQATFAQQTFEIKFAVDNQPNKTKGWAVAPNFGQNQTAVFELQQPTTDAQGTAFTFTLNQMFDGQHNIGRFRISVTTDKTPISLTGPKPAIAKILKVEPAKRTPQDLATLRAEYTATDLELQRLQRDFAEVNPVPEKRQIGAQDLAWALINTKEFLFNR